MKFKYFLFYSYYVITNGWINKFSTKIFGFNSNLKLYMVSTNDPKLASIYPEKLDQEYKPFIPPLKNIKYRINELVPVSEIESIRMRYILVTTDELAQSCKQMVTQGTITFHDLASTISLCNVTKAKGGDAGDIFLNQLINQTQTFMDATDDIPISDSSNLLDSDTSFYQSLLDVTKSNTLTDTNNKLYNNYIPVELINAVCYMNKGDLKIIEISDITIPGLTQPEIGSTTSTQQNQKWYYLVQLLDVQTALSPILKQRRKQNFENLLLSYQPNKPTSSSPMSTTSMGKDNTQLTNPQMYNYYIETMGCQMNTADSERIEGQLQDLGYKKSEDINTSNLIIMNTCSIRDHAEQKVTSII